MSLKNTVSNILYKTYSLTYRSKQPSFPKNKEIGILFASAPRKNIPLGELIIREPFFRSLSENNKLYLISSDSFAKEVMKIDPFSKYFLKVIKFDDVNKYKFDQILNLQNYNFPKSYLGLLKKHSSKIYSISYASLLLNTKLWKYFNYYPKYYLSSRHELQRTFDIFGIKCNFNKDKFIPKINYKFKSKTKFDIAIVVFSEKSTKHWNFKNMSKFIFKNKNNKIVLLGGSDASPVANRLLKSFKLVNYVGKTNFRKLIDIVYNSKMIVTPDTGTAHLAAALNKKTIVLYGPTELGRWKPLGKKVTQMYKKDVCRCCGDTNHCKIKTHECMNIDIKKYF